MPGVDVTTVDPEPMDTEPPPTDSTPAISKRKRKADRTHHILHQATFKKPFWSYFHLALMTPSTTAFQKNTSNSGIESIDPVTTLSLLQPPLSSFLGLHGSSISIDVLKTCGRDVWIRVPRQDAATVEAALSNWVGWAAGGVVPGLSEDVARVQVAWRIMGTGESLGRLGDGGECVVGDGRDLFSE